MAIRWLEERPSIGIDPGLCVLDPPPPELLDVRSLCLWKAGHLPPPLLAGPRALGGPLLLQVWRRDELGVFERCYAGSGPVFCDSLGAWLVPSERLLRIADDRGGERSWPTAEEHERAEKERERIEQERERAARIEVERRLAALERARG